ncbi:hypothetical protein K466DRAFT_606608 [Polyporus arcularius HHB13444]|uniref:Uncharacterized protein n=1 Tax=Polyporus arcularius HHB13444 TaxID=1314778 RepID=A0A5C3NNM6_9APHY|nr:hypothetical protein K466DRAFT_606608 [Polyporus arcularius HHB13444]
MWEWFAAVNDSLVLLRQRVEQLTEKVDWTDTMPEAYNYVIQAKLEAVQECVRGDISRLHSEMEARNAGSREGSHCYSMASTCEMVVDEDWRDSDEGRADTLLGIHEVLVQLQRRVDALSGLGAANMGWGLENGGIRPSDAKVSWTTGSERQPAAQAMNGMEVTQRLSSLEDRVRLLEDKVTDAALHSCIEAYLEKVGFRTIHAPVD